MSKKNKKNKKLIKKNENGSKSKSRGGKGACRKSNRLWYAFYDMLFMKFQNLVFTSVFASSNRLFSVHRSWSLGLTFFSPKFRPRKVRTFAVNGNYPLYLSVVFPIVCGFSTFSLDAPFGFGLHDFRQHFTRASTQTCTSAAVSLLFSSGMMTLIMTTMMMTTMIIFYNNSAPVKTYILTT